MIHIHSPEELHGLTPLEKSHFYLSEPELARFLQPGENNEPLIASAELEAQGLLVRPFWVAEPDDIEGRAYGRYIVQHPEFELAVRSGVGARLKQAQALLPDDWQIILKAGFRPIEVQQRIFDDVKAYLRKKYPHWSAAKLLAETQLLVSDPVVKVPPHSTGAAVDVEILDRRTSRLVGMGARANTDGEKGLLYSNAITKPQQEHRLMLLKAMLAAGFAHHAYEWWHFSYGDVMWAIFYEQPSTLYGVIPT